ncbi:ABC transporter ATP-binding protein [Streptomyces sp. NBC_01352]|uniref:ABC transporter ATP-binding protein n=1 Tax=Streptomyces sp. NBC_01352 TaxID=2903834 RepID=UPI002E344617|nr:ABC transporter ATP-binding protein [Streptomyces sp. NBC_01352]
MTTADTSTPPAAEPAPPAPPAIAARGVTRRFPGVVANDRVTFEVLPGEIHALLGENGSGKTTLCKILTGLYRPDEGEVVVNGRPVRFRSPRDADDAGVFMVHQHFSLVDRLTVAENVVLGRSGSRRFLLDPRAAEEEVAAAAERFHLTISPRAFVGELSVGERQRVEILKALYRGARTLILDEPTTVLTPRESEELFTNLRGLARDGGSIIFISHRLREVTAVCDRVTVLRKGRTVGTVRVEGEKTDPRQLARLMVGREVSPASRERSADAHSLEGEPVVLEIDRVSADDDTGRPRVREVSLSVRRGEIVGIAGVAGNGQRELAEAITGLRARSAGRVSVAGRALPSGNPRDAADAGVAYVPEDRMGTGLAPGLRITDNLMLKSYRRPEYSRGPFIRSKRAASRARDLITRFGIKGAADDEVRRLSGGNAQKVLLAREMSCDPRALVVAAPTRGLDVAAMDTVRTLLLEAADNGLSVLLISEDLDEVLDLADRVAVVYDGRVMGVVDRGPTGFDSARRDGVGLMMAGMEAAT